MRNPPSLPTGNVAMRLSHHRAAIFLLAVVWVISATAQATAQVVETETRVTSFTGEQADPSVVAVEDTVVAVWFPPSSHNLTGWSLSVDGGEHWNAGGILPSATGVIAYSEGIASVCVGSERQFYISTRLL